MPKRKKTKTILIIFLVIILLSFIFINLWELFKTESYIANWEVYSPYFKSDVVFPAVLTEDSCKEILRNYQTDINDIPFKNGTSWGLTWKDAKFHVEGLFNGTRTITFTFTDQGFEGCNILDEYNVEKIGSVPNFKQFYDCPDCEDVIKTNGRFFYSYKSVENYYELEYLQIDYMPQGNVTVKVQFIYINRSLDNFIEYRKTTT